MVPSFFRNQCFSFSLFFVFLFNCCFLKKNRSKENDFFAGCDQKKVKLFYCDQKKKKQVLKMTSWMVFLRNIFSYSPNSVLLPILQMYHVHDSFNFNFKGLLCLVTSGPILFWRLLVPYNLPAYLAWPVNWQFHWIIFCLQKYYTCHKSHAMSSVTMIKDLRQNREFWKAFLELKKAFL